MPKPGMTRNGLGLRARGRAMLNIESLMHDGWGRRRGDVGGRLLACRLINLVENPAIAEVILLRLGPSARHLLDGEQLYLRILRRVLRDDFFRGGPVLIFAGTLLALVRIQVFKVSSGTLATSLLFLGPFLCRHGRF